MAKVYYRKIKKGSTADDISEMGRDLLKKVVSEEKIKLRKKIPLKVHFGEAGCETYVKSENYDGIIDFLEDKGIETCFIETSVLYGGKRFKRSLHLETAKSHGFTRLPIVIADGDHGENFDEIRIDKNHYETCKIGGEFRKYDQVLVIAHFKGHAMAGFGGAIKQLSMGHASKGGKLAMHLGIKPKVIKRKCVSCGLCAKACNEHAITIDKKATIDYEKCVGCGGCVAICPKKAITVITLKGVFNALFKGSEFKEKLVEYAYAAQKDKEDIYINFAMNITPGCDCEGKKQKIIMDDIGVFASIDPVSIDKACYDLAAKAGKKFKDGKRTFDYAEKIGLGSQDYELIEI